MIRSKVILHPSLRRLLLASGNHNSYSFARLSDYEIVFSSRRFCASAGQGNTAKKVKNSAKPKPATKKSSRTNVKPVAAKSSSASIDKAKMLDGDEKTPVEKESRPLPKPKPKKGRGAKKSATASINDSQNPADIEKMNTTSIPSSVSDNVGEKTVEETNREAATSNQNSSTRVKDGNRIEIDLPSLLGEWEQVLRDALSGTAQQPFSPPLDLTLQQRIAVVSSIQNAEDHPHLYALLNVQSNEAGNEDALSIHLINTESLGQVNLDRNGVSATDRLTLSFMSFLKFYSQVARQNPSLLQNYRVLTEGFLQTLIFKGVNEKKRTKSSCVPANFFMNYTHVIFLYNEFLRSLERNRSETGEGEENEVEETEAIGKKKGKKRSKASHQIPKSVADVIEINDQLCKNYFDAILFNVNEEHNGFDKDANFDELLLEYIYWSVASELGERGHTGLSCRTQVPRWRERAKQIEKHFRDMLKVDKDDFSKMETKSLACLLKSILSSFKYVNQMELIVPFNVQKEIENRGLLMIENACRASTENVKFLEVLCSAEVALSVESLRIDTAGKSQANRSNGNVLRSVTNKERNNTLSSRTYSQTCTLIFAALSNLHTDPVKIREIVNREEKLCLERSHIAKENPWERPQLHSTISELCYGILCCGYDPLSLLQSSLCTGINSLDLSDIVIASDSFSDAFAYSALPTRVSDILLQSCTQQIQHFLRDKKRMIVGERQSASAPPSLKERMSQFTPLRNLADGSLKEKGKELVLKGGLKGKKSAAATDSDKIIPLTDTNVSNLADETMYLSLHFIIEAILRGEKKTALTMMNALFPVLDAEGGPRLVMEALIYITDRFSYKLATVSVLSEQSSSRKATVETSSSSSETHLSMEEALSSTAAALLLHVSQSIQHGFSGKGTATSHAESSSKATTIEKSNLGGGRAKKSKVNHKPSVPDMWSSNYSFPELYRLVITSFTSKAIVCGLSPNSIHQLVSLHQLMWNELQAHQRLDKKEIAATTTLKDAVHDCSEIVGELEKSKFPMIRCQGSLASQYLNTSINEIVSLHFHLASKTAVEAGIDVVVTDTKFHPVVINIVRFVSKLMTEYPVAVEPVRLYAFRTEILDPFLVRHLTESTTNTTTAPAPRTMSELTEISTVMLRKESIHMLSEDLLRALAKAVVKCVDKKTHVSSFAFALLKSFLVICLLAEDRYIQIYAQMLSALAKQLNLLQSSTVLQLTIDMGGAAAQLDPLFEMYHRLAVSVASGKANLTIAERLLVLEAMTRYRAEVPQLATRENIDFHAFLISMVRFGALKRISLTHYGVFAQITGNFCRFETDEAKRKEASEALRSLTVRLVPRIQGCPIHCVAPIVHGYSLLPEDVKELRTLRDQVLSAYISRIIRCSSLLSPADITTCVEAYCRAGIYQQYFFGVLLARLSDVKQMVTLEITVRLFKCGINTNKSEVRLSCFTAAKPLFLSQVRSVLQRDPNFFATVVSSSTKILECLRAGLPQEPICNEVLEAIAQHHHHVRLPILLEALRLIAARNGSDLETLRILTDRSITVIFPSCSVKEFVQQFDLLVRCGVRSSKLLDAVKEKVTALAIVKAEGKMKAEKTRGKTDTSEISQTSVFDGHSLAVFAKAFQMAFINMDKTLLETVSTQASLLCKKSLSEAKLSTKKQQQAVLSRPSYSFTFSEVCILLQFYFSAGEAYVFPLQPSVDLLLNYLGAFWDVTDINSLNPEELCVIVRTCKVSSSQVKRTVPLLQKCADRIVTEIKGMQEDESSNMPKTNVSDPQTVRTRWITMDLFSAAHLLRNLLECDAQLAQHELFKLVLEEIIFKRKNILLQRQMVRDEVTQVLKIGGKDLHSELWNLLEL